MSLITKTKKIYQIGVSKDTFAVGKKFIVSYKYEDSNRALIVNFDAFFTITQLYSFKTFGYKNNIYTLNIVKKNKFQIVCGYFLSVFKFFII